MLWIKGRFCVVWMFAFMLVLAGMALPGTAKADCVIGVSSHDVLWMRDGPGTSFNRVAAIPHNSCDISRNGGCAGSWCSVSWSGVSGWVNSRYLSADRPPNNEGYDRCVTGVRANDVLWLRGGPGASYRKLRGIPAYSCGLAVLGNCSGNWCQADFDGIVGWVNMQYVR